MVDTKTVVGINCAVLAEMNAAIENHGEFNSHHEGWAVLREEVQEVVECFVPFDGTAHGILERLWELIREDAMFEDEARSMVTEIHDAAGALAEECIQVMAVCMKWQKLIAKECE